MISAGPRGTVFSPNPEEIAAIVPDIALINLEFQQPDRITMLDAHYAVRVVCTFRNGKELTIPGFMLWKFLDAIPPELGSDATGYFDQNPFSNEHGSKIMERVRAAYWSMFARGEGYRPPHPPLRATIDLAGRTVATTYSPKLSDDVRREILKRSDKAVAAMWPKSYAALCAWVADAISRPRTVLGMVDLGNGRLRNQYGVDRWPAPETMTFDQFLNEFSSERFTTHPAHMTYSQCFSRLAEEAARDVVISVFASMQKDEHPMVEEVAAALGVVAEENEAEYLAEALDQSQDADLVFDLIWSRWFRAMKSQTIAELIAD